ncbi:hypothetical protein AALO_G00178510 [Alosa alosa]|uniref:Uncharacterized protein n=1 Tax=Alosa alosa TaxID=278164 RepID=A0AAV6G879_9TELE|nr:hypothetical protein AALO_G00178510 [Alosa alosa]
MMAGNFNFAVIGLIELSIGSLILAFGVILKGINVEVHNPLNRERLTLLPYAALILLSGLCLLLPAIKPSPSLIRFNLYTHLVDVIFSLVCCGLVAKNTPYQSETSSTAGYSVNNILGILIGQPSAKACLQHHHRPTLPY